MKFHEISSLEISVADFSASIAERKDDEERLATYRKDYHACGPEWLRANAYRFEAACMYGNARIARLERLLRDAGGEW